MGRAPTHAAATVALVAVVVLAGCVGFVEFGSIAEPDANRPDPDADTRGWEDGFWWNDDVAVDASDGLTTAELEVVVARMMARIERLRGHEYASDVDVTVISRATYRDRQSTDWDVTLVDEQLWEATFVLGEDEPVDDAFDDVYGTAVQGYYSDGRIVVIGDETDGGVHVPRSVLVHELVHALQDQRLSIAVDGTTRDGRLAARSVVEGDATYVEYLYEQRCANETWSCVASGDPTDGGGESESPTYDRGLFVSTYAPYAAGATFVAALQDRGDWDAVDAAFADRPASTAQVIHPAAYPDDPPVDVTIPDRSSSRWERVGPTQRVGEATAYAMFWDNGQIPRSHYRSNDAAVTPFTYDHPLTDGWRGDALAAYRRDDGDGYVWKTTWETQADARAFHDAYLSLLASHDAVERGDGVYVIRDGPFADAFRVALHGNTVLVVNAPTVDALDEIHDPRDADRSPDRLWARLPAIGDGIATATTSLPAAAATAGHGAVSGTARHA
jgi:hypothetical protein